MFRQESSLEGNKSLSGSKSIIVDSTEEKYKGKLTSQQIKVPSELPPGLDGVP